jgi:hypothetical protein
MNSSDKQKPDLGELVVRLVDVAQKAQRFYEPGEIFYGLIAAAIRYAAGHASADAVARLLRGLAVDIEEVQRAHTPVDPKSIN